MDPQCEDNKPQRIIPNSCIIMECTLLDFLKYSELVTLFFLVFSPMWHKDILEWLAYAPATTAFWKVDNVSTFKGTQMARNFVSG